ncbi:DNA replication/repair protein RecF [Paraurantiacibacter namhicola]|uniref:DNA replication and repair protein RecF n=1 Tax=Paraurantiacibacter namhicola TaxID=645517 RepID=A0A1C7DAJ5_9SPHN|nr:DNA replication/repair protein RecF [Paraurantiacibacter namhicola]ANU08506.1 DNA replication and repair protein RecF [Paraurantiacibacter namhicola]
MALDRITLSTFRNHAGTCLDGTGKLNLLVGENGAGKTNILEALSLLAPGRGMRRAALSEMAGSAGDGGFAVSARLDAGGAEPVQLGTGMRAERPGRRVVQVNGAQTTAVELGEWLAVGWLTPAMDRLFADGAAARRRYLDRLVVAIDPDHARQSARYEAGLRERNRIMSDGPSPNSSWLGGLEAQMAEAGAAVAAGRAVLVERLGAELERLPEGPFARPVLEYLPNGPLTADALAAELAEGRARDRAAQRTLSGPHRDELAVSMAGMSMAAANCSTGEQKAMLIAMTLAHARLAADTRPGILLLDEVAAHLDPVRRAALFARLLEGGTQVWLTGTELAPFDEIRGSAAIWRVEGGQVERL